MSTHRKLAALALAIGLIAAACGDDSTTSETTGAPAISTTATSGAPTTTTTAPAATTTTSTPAPTTTAAPATTAGSGVPIEINDGQVTIDWSSVGNVHFAPPAAGSSDPFYFVHTFPDVAGFYFSVEAYTTGYGTAWTGQLGTFAIDCSPGGSGICVHFDPDGTGDLGADFLATGDIDVIQADNDGFEAVLTNVTFTDGTTIPGPLTVTG